MPGAPPAATQPPPDSTVLVITKKVQPDYPAAVLPEKLQGQVVIHIVVDEDGDVESAEVISGNPVLAGAAVDAAKQWKFKPFIRNGQPVKAGIKLPFDFAPPEPATVAVPAAGEKSKEALAEAGTKSGDSDPNAKPAESAPQPTAIKVPERVSQKVVVHRVTPQYPPLALSLRLQGAVVVGVTVSKDGTVEKVHVISGHPVLIQAALDAVKQWRYQPYLVNGEPVEVETAVTVVFALHGATWGSTTPNTNP